MVQIKVNEHEENGAKVNLHGRNWYTLTYHMIGIVVSLMTILQCCIPEQCALCNAPLWPSNFSLSYLQPICNIWKFNELMLWFELVINRLTCAKSIVPEHPNRIRSVDRRFSSFPNYADFDCARLSHFQRA